MDYRNPAECLALLKRLHSVGIDETQTVLTDMVSRLLEARPAPNQHLEVLEAARGQIAFVQGELARRYASHPLPPDGMENETLRRVVALWDALARSYAQIARLDAAEGTLGDQRPLLAQRRTWYAGQGLLEYYRAHRVLPPGAWNSVHACHAQAEANGIGRIRVTDPLNEVWKAQSAAEAHVAVLLVDLANPFGRSERELNWVCRWAQRFAPYCVLQAEREHDSKPTAYGLDLALDHGLRPLGLLAAGPSLRRFDGARLAGQIQAVLTQFKQGVQPASLGLGEDCPVDASARLLLSLYRPWGLASAGRRFPRRGARGTADVCGDWLAIGFHVQGKAFDQPVRLPNVRSLRSDISLMTFGERAPEVHSASPEQLRRQEAEKLGFVPARWEMADHSVSGFRLRQRPHHERLEHQQLVGIRPPDGERFLLGQISWLMYRDDGVMEAGVQMLAGLPQVVAARQVGLHAGGAYQQAFLLPATPALKTPTSLVLPAGWFHAQRVIELHHGNSMQVRLTDLMLRGTNFDQVNFEPLAESPA